MHRPPTYQPERSARARISQLCEYEDYVPPQQQQVNVGIQIGGAWLDALRALEAEDAEIIQDPPAEPYSLTPPLERRGGAGWGPCNSTL